MPAPIPRYPPVQPPTTPLEVELERRLYERTERLRAASEAEEERQRVELAAASGAARDAETRARAAALGIDLSPAARDIELPRAGAPMRADARAPGAAVGVGPLATPATRPDLPWSPEALSVGTPAAALGVAAPPPEQATDLGLPQPFRRVTLGPGRERFEAPGGALAVDRTRGVAGVTPGLAAGAYEPGPTPVGAITESDLLGRIKTRALLDSLYGDAPAPGPTERTVEDLSGRLAVRQLQAALQAPLGDWRGATQQNAMAAVVEAQAAVDAAKAHGASPEEVQALEDNLGRTRETAKLIFTALAGRNLGLFGNSFDALLAGALAGGRQPAPGSE